MLPFQFSPHRLDAEEDFAHAQNDKRKNERTSVIEKTEDQQAGDQVFLIVLQQRNHHRRVEHADATRRMAGKSQKRCRHENNGQRHKADMRLVRQQHVHCQRAAREIDDANGDLQQRRGTVRQFHEPTAAPQCAPAAPNPDDIGCKNNERDDGNDRVHRRRELVDARRGTRHIKNAKPEHGCIAEPEGQPGDEAQFGDLDSVEPMRRINAERTAPPVRTVAPIL